MVPVTGLMIRSLATANVVWTPTGSACLKRWHKFDMSMPSPHELQCLLDQPVCGLL